MIQLFSLLHLPRVSQQVLQHDQAVNKTKNKTKQIRKKFQVHLINLYKIIIENKYFDEINLPCRYLNLWLEIRGWRQIPV